MTRIFSSYPVHNYPDLKEKLLFWASSFPVCCLLDSFGYADTHHSYDMLIGVGVEKQLVAGENKLSSISTFDADTNDWIFGHVGYDALGLETKTVTPKKNGSGLPAVFLFVPELVVQLQDDMLSIGVLYQQADKIFREILETIPPATHLYHARLKHRISREHFTDTVANLQRHIQRGDCYEINYCQEFFVESIIADPADIYRQLTSISPNPFSSFYKIYDQFALCASPERYLKKTGQKIISQPIKGTASRAPGDPVLDAANRILLQQSEKDRRENVIVVDLVRNDLGRVCRAGSVVVEELFGVYAFPTVYQMISTVAGNLETGQDFARVLEASFPMGSMTGAPKKKVMELIDQFETVTRGLYAGTIGYIDPQKDYDFNVVIRTLLYNQKTGYLNYFTGAGITSLSDPELEYEECLLKAAALDQLFGQSETADQSSQA